MPDAHIETGGLENVPELEPLWTALQEHHGRLDGIPPIRDIPESWARRRAQYESWLGEGSARLFIARRDGAAIAYLMMRVGGGATTWAVGDDVAELETLAVLEGERSAGLGRSLMDAAVGAAEMEGVRAIGVGVVHSNARAIRFYERAGFRPFLVEMLRLKEG